MKDLPFFTTPYGVASLILREITYQEIAYIRLQATEQPEELLRECVDFCKAVGACRAYATGHDYLMRYPYHTTILQMQCDREVLQDADVSIWPLQEDRLTSFLEIYRQKVKKIPNAAWLTDADGKELARKGGGYFIHRQGVLLGIGIVEGSKLRFVASVMSGAGESCVRALAGAITEDTVILEVADTNEKAMSLYERLGFVKTKVLSEWYEVM